jgi:hypothetical protein
MRVVLEGEAYRALWRRLYARQQGKCGGCGLARAGLQVHHEKGRGLGGGFREDTEENTILLCEICHPVWDKKRKSKFRRKV